MYNGGHQYEFGQRLAQEHGQEFVDDLVQRGKFTAKYAHFELEDKLRHYEKKYKELL